MDRGREPVEDADVLDGQRASARRTRVVSGLLALAATALVFLLP